ncbi:hypothetical protein [Halomonas korlensis]|nr:hypothetical protein [Halomonas korlensis]
MLMVLLLIGLFVPNGHLAFFIALVTYIYIGLIVERRSSVHMMFFLGFSTFIFLPAILNWYYLGVEFSLYFLTTIASLLFIFLTRKTKVKPFYERGAVVYLFISMCFFCLALVVLGEGGLVKGLFAFLIILMSMSFSQNNFRRNSAIFSAFFLVFIAYALFSWSGFGRTVTVGWLLLAGLQFAYSVGFHINKYVFGLIPGLAATLFSSRDLLKLKFNSFEAALYDSAYAPYRFASSLIEQFEQRGYDFAGFFDQIIFTLFVFVPRDIWPSKPYGFGFEYTVRHLDTYLVDAGHSVASTLIGDHIYYLGYLGVFTSLIIMAVLAVPVNFLYRIKGLNGNGVLLFSASMMVLVWGGMTSFSARVALPSIMFVILFILLRRFLTRKVKFVWEH